ncbi:MAG: hypothetical protein ACRDTD_06905 [Pseudonocardiaceae bacterium]
MSDLHLADLAEAGNDPDASLCAAWMVRTPEGWGLMGRAIGSGAGR